MVWKKEKAGKYSSGNFRIERIAEFTWVLIRCDKEVDRYMTLKESKQMALYMTMHGEK